MYPLNHTYLLYISHAQFSQMNVDNVEFRKLYSLWFCIYSLRNILTHLIVSSSVKELGIHRHRILIGDSNSEYGREVIDKLSKFVFFHGK